MMSLTGPEGVYALKPSLKLVAALEGAYGSLYLLAEDLLDKSLPLSEMVDVVKTLYRHAGCKTADDALDEFLLRQPCTDMLINFLLEVLGPVEKAVTHPPRPFLDEMMKKFPDDSEVLKEK